MALRVLLADESTTIKKVIQLALQDYGVDVKSVPIGLDVTTVAKSYKPDLIFVDVLLQKRSGYDVAQDIKKDPELTKTPVILMWSGFMELDEAKATASKADRRLEKPFDAEILRNMVRELVPRTQSNIVGEYLRFPPRPDFDEGAKREPQPTAPEKKPTVDFSAPAQDPLAFEIPTEKPLDLAVLPEIGENENPADDFQSVPLVSRTPEAANFGANGEAGEETWNHQDIKEFSASSPSGEEGGDLSNFVIPSDDMNVAEVQDSGEFQEITFSNKAIPSRAQAQPSAPAPKAPAARPAGNAIEARADQILREESRAVLEKIAWQILPDLCERLVKEELNKLLKEAERSIENG